MSESENTQAADEQAKQFAINRIYIKDVSFESPNYHEQITADWNPETNLDLTTNGRVVENNLYEVVISLTLTAKNNEQNAYLVEVQQAGIFTIDGFSEEELAHMLGTFCPNILFPYARETISELVTKGGFPHMYLAPVNFDAIYAQHLQELAKQAEQQEQ
jgi:preprotein translocase subunit SecB